jgi:hypothetical protein
MPSDPAPAALPAGISASAFSSLFQAVNGLRNRAALGALVGCTVVGVVVAGLLMAMSGALGVLAGLLAFTVFVIAVGTGVNAAGLLHMDSARGVAPRGMVDALVYGLMCIPKLIVLGLALVAVEIAVFIVLAIVLFICRIPFLGPLLFTVVFPVSVVIAGITVCGLFLCLVLSLPAIWQGATITRALAQTLTIARTRLIEAVLLLVFVALLSFAAAMVVFGVLSAGLAPMLGLSASIVGGGGMEGMGSVLGMMQGGGFGASGQVIAGFIGSAVLWAVATSLVNQVSLLGLCLVYLRVTEGLDPAAAEAALHGGLAEARRRASEFGDMARAATHRDGGVVAGAASAAAMSTRPPVAEPSAAPSPAAAPGHPPPHEPATAFAMPPAFSPPASVYSPPPASAPPHHFIAPAPPDSVDPDISLPFDDPPPPASKPGYAAAPAYLPGPAQAPVPAALPPITTCPQCLSAVTADDLFCGVCGYRLK